MTPDKVEAALASLAALIEKKRRQADMADHPKANEYGRGAASAMRVVSDEMADELMNLTSVMTGAMADYRELRLAVWKARAILGFDNDGDETPDALTHPSLAELVVRDAREFRDDCDAAAKG